MSWQNSLQDASFRGVTFDVVRTRDSAKRSLAEHEYPYLDGADVEDLGRRARRMSITALFWGDDYETRLKAFIDVLDQAGSGELIHPVFGSIAKAQLEDYDVEHDAEHVDYCTVSLAFIEATPGNPFFVQQLPSQKAEAVSALTDAVRTNGIAAFGTVIALLNSVQGNIARLNALRDVMTGTLGAIRNQVQNIIGTTLDIIEYPQAFAADVVSYVSGMADLRSFDVGVIVSDWKSLTGQLSNTVELPAGINGGVAMASSSAGMMSVGITSSSAAGASSGTSSSSSTSTSSSTSSASTASTSTTTTVGTGSALVPANANATDVAAVQAVVQVAVATQLADTASGILADEAADAALSPTDIELIVGNTRTAIQAAIDLHRELFTIDVSRPITEGLKDIALAVQTAAIAVINARPPLGLRTVTVAGNLHLTAFRWYGDYSRAVELARLNPQITNPNFLMPGDVLNAYAQ